LLAKIIKLNESDAIISIARDTSERKQNQQRIINAIIQTEEKERERIARDLHDGISPVLSTVKLYSQSLNDCEDGETCERIIKNIQDSVEEAISGLSEISNNISPHVLRNYGLIAALDTFTRKVKNATKIDIDYISDFRDKLNEKIEISLYRIITELVNNTIKYAGAKKISIRLMKENDLSVFYSDDGKGFNYPKILKDRAGMGLFNIQNRVHFLNGKIFIDSKLNKGVNIKIHIPLT